MKHSIWTVYFKKKFQPIVFQHQEYVKTTLLSFFILVLYHYHRYTWLINKLAIYSNSYVTKTSWRSKTFKNIYWIYFLPEVYVLIQRLDLVCWWLLFLSYLPVFLHLMISWTPTYIELVHEGNFCKISTL